MIGSMGSGERRSSGRVRASGTAIVYGASIVHGRIADLAIGGLSLLVDSVLAFEVGSHVRLAVRLDGLGRWVRLTGFIVRVEAGGSGAAIAIELFGVPQDFEDVVQNELLSELECARVPQILLVDGARGRRELVAAALRATGCRVITVSSPLEAIFEIDQSKLHLRAVVIANTSPASHADELRRFLSEVYPVVALIEIGTIDFDTPALSLQIDRLVRKPGRLMAVAEPFRAAAPFGFAELG